jgi:hypothetical protein
VVPGSTEFIAKHAVSVRWDRARFSKKARERYNLSKSAPIKNSPVRIAGALEERENAQDLALRRDVRRGCRAILEVEC